MNYIFDFDGTLMDTAPVILATMQATIAELHLPARTEAECRATIGLRLESIPRALFPGHSEASAEYAATYRRLFPRFNQHGIAKPFPHVIETLSALRARGAAMAIASSRSRQSLEEFIAQMNLADTFQLLIGGDDVKNGKPSPDPVLAILRALHWDPAGTLVIGDAAVDIAMGKAAGTKTCGVTYGNGTPDELLNARPDALIDNFSEILELQN